MIHSLTFAPLEAMPQYIEVFAKFSNVLHSPETADTPWVNACNLIGLKQYLGAILFDEKIWDKKSDWKPEKNVTDFS